MLVLRVVPAGGGEERLLQLLGDGPPAVRTHGAVVDLADRDDFGSRPRVERLLRRVEVEPREVPLHDRVAEVTGDRDDRVPGDAVQASGRKRRCVEDAVFDDEDVLPWSVGDVAGHVEHDSFVVTGVEGLYLGQTGVDVLARGLRPRRKDVVVTALPRGDLGPP